jgi:hypothetical protein
MRGSPLDLDGQVVTVGEIEFELRAEIDEDGGSSWAVCQSCGVTVAQTDRAMESHECDRCVRCGSVCVDVVYDEGQQAYLPSKQWETWCSDDCHDESAEAAAVRS